MTEEQIEQLIIKHVEKRFRVKYSKRDTYWTSGIEYRGFLKHKFTGDLTRCELVVSRFIRMYFNRDWRVAIYPF